MPCCRPLRLTMPCGTPATWRGLARRARGARKRFGGCWRLLQQEGCDLFGGVGEGGALAGAVVEFVDDCGKGRFGDGLKSVPLGSTAEQAVGVLVGAALPGGVRVAEEDLDSRADADLLPVAHLGALVPGQ